MDTPYRTNPKRFSSTFWIIAVAIIGVGVGAFGTWLYASGYIGQVTGIDTTHRAVGKPAPAATTNTVIKTIDNFNRSIENSTLNAGLKAAVATDNPDNPAISTLVYADFNGDQTEDVLVGYKRVGTAQTLIAQVYTVDASGALKKLWQIPDGDTLGHSGVAIGGGQTVLYYGASGGGSVDTFTTYKWTGTTFGKQ